MTCATDIPKLLKKYEMMPHEENGMWAKCSAKERKMVKNGEEYAKRQPSGSIYYYVAPGEFTKFHVIDCDEYWIHNCGDAIKIYCIDPAGKAYTEDLGSTAKEKQSVFVKRGTFFASKVNKSAHEGAFITCVTVPQFRYGESHVKIIELEDMPKEVKNFPKEWLSLSE